LSDFGSLEFARVGDSNPDSVKNVVETAFTLEGLVRELDVVLVGGRCRLDGRHRVREV
jgi:hypothetical protein